MEGEVFFSGCSHSTQASGIQVGKSLQQTDNETLEAQIDRLNFALLGILKNDEKEFCDSFSFQAFEEFMVSEEDYSEKQDKIDQKFERSTMIIEDFRSHETRNASLSRGNFKISIQLDELHRVRNEISKALELAEKKISNIAKIKIGEILLEIDIIDEMIFTTKNEVVSGFTDKSYDAGLHHAYVKQLENELEELNYNAFHSRGVELLEKTMFESYMESFPTEYPILKCPKIPAFNSISHTQSSLEIEYKTMRGLNNTRKEYLKELEWELAQAKLIKTNFEEKTKSLDEKEKKMSKYVQNIHNELYKKIKSLETEKAKCRLEQEKAGKIIRFLRDFKQQVKKIKDGIVVKEPLTISIPTPCATPKHTPKPSLSLDEAASIELEIAQLESELLEASDKNALTFKINHLRTKLSTLRSAKILNSEVNVKRFNSFIKTPRSFVPATPKADILSKLELDMNNMSVPSTPRVSARRFTCFNNRFPEQTNEIIPQENTVVRFPQLPTEEFAKEENLAKALEYKESRLRRKEEELNKREITLQNTWMKLPNANELIPIIRAQMSYYEMKCKNLDQAQAEIDKLVKENLENKKMIKNAQENTKKFVSNLEDKKAIAEKLEDLIKDVDEFII
ncbi:hypothetical protein SteCoe_3179 [Stentor coeruleus]|uniref:Uncharacterized protein n=1 Tax=Stentor coeruleus TaxID=5963 RepID=A0A1R2CXK0_9CILI|nr:hypothetical protein SteCoe_3179 [Stentor coeruleus]